jgi:hypothetical protein
MAVTVETIIAADVALTRLINLTIDLMEEKDDPALDDLVAEADAMDQRRQATIDKIRARQK